MKKPLTSTCVNRDVVRIAVKIPAAVTRLFIVYARDVRRLSYTAPRNGRKEIGELSLSPRVTLLLPDVPARSFIFRVRRWVFHYAK